MIPFVDIKFIKTGQIIHGFERFPLTASPDYFISIYMDGNDIFLISEHGQPVVLVFVIDNIDGWLSLFYY